MENTCSKPPTSHHVPYWKYYLGGGIHHFETDSDESVGCSFIHWGRKRTKLKSISVPFRIAGAEVRINGWYVGSYILYICMYIYIYGMWLMWIYLNNDGYLGPKSGIQLRLIHTGIQAAIGVLRTSCIIPWTLHSGGSPIGRSESGLIAYFRICVWRALSLCLEMPRTSDVPEPSKG